MKKELTKKDAKFPEDVYQNDFKDVGCEPMNYIPCVCPTCNQEVPYSHFCCECGQKFKKRKLIDKGSD